MKKIRILSQRRSNSNEQFFFIHSVNAESFDLLVKQREVQIFIMFMKDIDQQFQFDMKSQVKSINLNNVEIVVVNLQNIKKKLFFEYHDYFDVFDRAHVNQLFSHRNNDHKIEFLNDVKSSQSRTYRMFSYKFKKIKKYFIENLFKNFITFNKTLYFSSMLFTMKVNENLRFCVDYRKFNVMTKRNQYFLSLIKKIIEKIIECKHFIKLNIITVFNKFRMHFDNKNYTTFITILNIYKYRVLSFDLINGFNLFQQYINDILWKFLNDFCQVYFDDILIYNRIKRKHIRYVCLILNKFCEVDLQMNIKKCEFNVEKIVFLNVIISKFDLRMNSEKMKIIVN